MRADPLPKAGAFDLQQTAAAAESLRRQLQSEGVRRADGAMSADGAAFLAGKLLHDVEFAAGAVAVIQHNLGYVPRGWELKRVRGSAQLTFEQSATSSELSIQSLTSITADVWVY